jgi:hypothetical protein
VEELERKLDLGDDYTPPKPEGWVSRHQPVDSPADTERLAAGPAVQTASGTDAGKTDNVVRPKFVYIRRTAEQWAARVNQTGD